MTFSYSPETDRIHDSLTGRDMARDEVNRLLAKWQDWHDELLRTPGHRHVLDARTVRRCWLDLEVARPPQWTEADATEGAIPDLANVVFLGGRNRWAAVPGEAA